MATDDTNTSNQGSSNNITGNGNWELKDGQWQSGSATLPNAETSGGGENPVAGGGASGGGSNPFAGGGASGGGNPLAGGNSSSDSNYQYERPLDERALTDSNNPFNQLIEVTGNPSDSGDGSSPLGGGNNPFAGGGSAPSGDASSAAGGQNLPGNLPFGSTPPSEESGSNLPESGKDGQPVPYNSENWISDVQTIDSADATGNTANGNGNWFSGSNNTVDGNGNWSFSDGNTTSGNGNWLYSSGGTTNGNGNWNFGSDNATDGNGNWNLGDGNDILGNANQPTGSDNDILGSGNTSDVSGSSLLGNRIEASGEGNTLVGNEGWNFPVSGDSASSLTSLGSSTPSSAIGFDISNGVGSLFGAGGATEGTINTATSLPDYNNPNYDFSGVSA